MKTRRSTKGGYNFVLRPPTTRERAFCADNQAALNLLSTGKLVFEIEKELKDRIVRRATLPLFSERVDLRQLRLLLESLITYVLVEQVDLRFRKLQGRKKRLHGVSTTNGTSSVCLFSGGTDSYAGLLLAKEQLGQVEAVFCAHSDQSRIIHIVESLRRRILQKTGIGLNKLPVPSIGARGYAQTRGFLYLLAAATQLSISARSTLVVSECGPTMYQPLFSPFDSITMTTHPVVVDCAKAVIELVLERKIQMLTPFEDLTKAETMAISPAKEGLRYTHSCVTQRFGQHDGTCYGCVIRRLGAIAAGVPDVKYNKNPLSDEEASSGNLFSLLTFCFDVLVNKQQMPGYQIEPIVAYGKTGLFERFALDNFAAIHRLLGEGWRVRPSVKRIYQNVRSQVGVSVLDQRLSFLRRPRFSAQF